MKDYLIKSPTISWICKGAKWNDFVLRKKVLTTDSGVYELHQEKGKIQVYKKDAWIGTVKKVYEGIFDAGEYEASFDPGEDLHLFLIIASILAIDVEVIQRSAS